MKLTKLFGTYIIPTFIRSLLAIWPGRFLIFQLFVPGRCTMHKLHKFHELGYIKFVEAVYLVEYKII